MNNVDFVRVARDQAASHLQTKGAYEAELLAGAATVTVGKQEGKDGSQVVGWPHKPT